MSKSMTNSGEINAHSLPWRDPLPMLEQLVREHRFVACLHSGLDVGFSGKKTLIAIGDEAHVKAKDFSLFAQVLSETEPAFTNAWFGYLGYELNHSLESLPKAAPFGFALPKLWMIHYQTVLLFDHPTKTLTAYTKNADSVSTLPEAIALQDSTLPAIASLSSPMTKEEYFTKVGIIREAILRGDLYQANLTRKFQGEFAAPPCPISVFTRLCTISPAPYSAFLKFKNTVILSSSPEQFMHVTPNGIMETRPIKGSAPRFADKTKDSASRDALASSSKDKAENLMIVDLMRNDFSRSAETGTVQVPGLFDITSYATVHHMASTIQAHKRAEISTLSAVTASFPPGSMTGAPKIKAMELCSQLEGIERGIYSGAIGWFGGDGSCDLSVVIRTIILEGTRWEFQVGGAIVADSTPQGEWEETLTKAKGISQALGIEESALRAL
ncbi:MAG: hypothetical protein K0R63_577 [Rickettsiales bacterium]|jgi:aminodeoxychorismate synthase component I|nr:hypothetical protein [Rickettsiales bacterium]